MPFISSLLIFLFRDLQTVPSATNRIFLAKSSLTFIYSISFGNKAIIIIIIIYSLGVFTSALADGL